MKEREARPVFLIASFSFLFYINFHIPFSLIIQSQYLNNFFIIQNIIDIQLLG